MQVRPRDDVLAAGTRGGQAQPLQYRAEAHLDADQFEAAPAAAGQHDVGHPGQPLAHDVDDLGVQHVARQQDLAVTECRGQVVDGEAPGVCGVERQHHLVVPEVGDLLPRDQQLRPATPADHHPVGEGRAGLLHQIGRQVGEAADDPAVPSEHIVTGDPAEQQHIRSMPHGTVARLNPRKRTASAVQRQLSLGSID